MTSRTLPGVDTTMQDPLVGREVDSRYLIESRIAHGGMANVYLALDRRLDREVAFKVLYEHLSSDDEFVSRFVREARAAARLSHPNAVQVFDQGSDGPVLYLAMEYLPGRTLRDVLLQRGALTPREATSVMEPVLGALGAAHRAGIVHRDVKPENVILTDDGRIKVADFGLARAVAAPMTGASSGQLIGTVAYLAPELVSRGVADARADVYAAGILLFELLTGKQPFSGDDPLQVAYRHVHETVPRPSEVSAGVTPEFDDLVLRATNRDPDERPADADAFLAELRAVSAGVSPEALDVRTAEADDLRKNALTVVNGAPAPAGEHQATRALIVEGPGRRAAAAAGAAAGAAASGLAQLVPRLRINDDDDAEQPDGLFSSPRARALALVGLIAGVLAVVLIAVWYFASGPGAYTKTPQVIQLQNTAATKVLADHGLRGKVVLVFNDTVSAGLVVSTEPEAGQRIRKNGVVTMNVSKGREQVGVPALKGKTLDQAKDLLAQARLTLGPTDYEYSNDIDKDKVIKTVPKAGTKLDPDSKVTFVVSKGVQMVPFQNVVGTNVDISKKALEDAGFDVRTTMIDWIAGGPAPGTITASDPVFSSQSLPKGSAVTLTAVAEPKPVVVPSVIGQNVDDAANYLRQLGFNVIVEHPFFSQQQNVRFQSVTGEQPFGSTITISTERDS